MSKIPITKEGYDRLYEELERLQSGERQKNAGEILKAREFGDVSENAEFSAAKEQQALINGRISRLSQMLADSHIIPTDHLPTDRAVFGSTLEVQELDTGKVGIYKLVGPYESAPEEGRVSVSSPIGRALVGQEEGAVVELKTPNGIKEIEILQIFP